MTPTLRRGWAQAIEEREKKLALIQWTERTAAEEIYCGGILHA
jgi:hypothetical protein